LADAVPMRMVQSFAILLELVPDLLADA